jgi:hypothetical protein
MVFFHYEGSFLATHFYERRALRARIVRYLHYFSSDTSR